MDLMEMKNIAKVLNNRTYTDYYYRLKLLAKSMFRWNNLPNGIDEKWIEQYLFNEGRCMIFKDDTFGLMVSKCTIQGLNHYDEPTELMPVATNYNKVKSYRNNKNCILIRNNDDMIATIGTIELYAYKLAELSRTIDINVNAQKTPVLIVCSDKQKLSLKNIYKQYQGNEPVIFEDKSLNRDAIQVLKTDAPIVFDKLEIEKHHIWNECMTFLGVNNANMDKKERLVDDEVQANNEQVIMNAEIMLKSRQEACKRINELFGTDITVELRSAKNKENKDKEDIEE